VDTVGSGGDEAIQKRIAGFQSFKDDSFDCVGDLAAAAGCQGPDAVASDPEKALAIIDPWLKTVQFGKLPQDDLMWMRVRIMYLVGEVLIARYGGQWEVQDDPASDLYGDIVVASFRNGIPFETILSPARTALEYTNAPPGGSLAARLATLHRRAIEQE
jgi:hypothetical protein